MKKKNDEILVDVPNKTFTNSAVGKVETKCDFCDAHLGSNYPAYGSVSVHLPNPKPNTSPGGSPDPYSDSDYDGQNKTFCSQGCLASYLGAADEDSGIIHGYSEADDEANADDESMASKEKEATARYISYKERKSLKSTDYIDQKRRSFPIKICKDISAAARAFSRYKGALSHAEFKAKLISKAKSMGCESSLPKSWKEDSKS